MLFAYIVLSFAIFEEIYLQSYTYTLLYALTISGRIHKKLEATQRSIT